MLSSVVIRLISSRNVLLVAISVFLGTAIRVPSLSSSAFTLWIHPSFNTNRGWYSVAVIFLPALVCIFTSFSGAVLFMYAWIGLLRIFSVSVSMQIVSVESPYAMNPSSSFFTGFVSSFSSTISLIFLRLPSARWTRVSPVTHFPEPFGPSTQLNSGPKSISVRFAKLLKPCMIILFILVIQCAPVSGRLY